MNSLHKYTLIGLCIVLLQVAIVHCEIPSDWSARVDTFNALYSPDDLKLLIDLPLLGNGYLSNNDGVTSDTMFVSGIFNGESTSPSHRASIPAALNNVRVQNASPLGALLDIEYATYYRRGSIQSIETSMSDRRNLRVEIEATDRSKTLSTASFVTSTDDSWYELRWYAHRSLRNVYVMELQVNLTNKKSAGNTTVSLMRGKDLPSTDLTVLFTDSDNVTNTFCAATKTPETSDGSVHTLCSVSTVVPSSVTISPTENGKTFTFLQTIFTSLDLNMTESSQSGYDMILKETKARYDAAMKLTSTGQLHSTHISEWAKLWTSGIEIQARSDVAVATNTSLYYILSSVRDDWAYGLAPGGLTNSYNGHSFWDTETWMYPSLLYLHPSIAQSLVKYRYDRLAGAHLKAASYDPPFQGAMFPWESAFSGQETCPTWASTGLREDHISGDIAFAIWQEWVIRRNETWLQSVGYPILSGIADFWVSIASYSSDGEAHINDIIPPDEFVDHVNDSVYTNFVAAQSLRYAVAAAEVLHLDCARCAVYSTLADALIILYDATLGIHPEYQGYSGDTVKQADVVLLHYPLGMSMNSDVIAADLNYYAPRTDTGGPAMTWGMFSIGYLDLMEFDQAAMYFNMSYQGNTHAPFSVWTETPTGGAGNFVTGAGGYLQTMTAGYPGMRLLTSANANTGDEKLISGSVSVNLDTLSLSPTCPEFATYVKVRSFDYMNCKFDFEYWCSGESGDHLPSKISIGINSCGDSMTNMNEFTFLHFQSPSIKDFFPYPTISPQQTFQLSLARQSEIVVAVDKNQGLFVMPLFAKLATPSFDLACISPPGLNDSIVLVPGGGGASKTGVKNLIQLATITKAGFKFKQHIETDQGDDSHLCSTICSNIVEDYVVVCAVATRQCLVYSLSAAEPTKSKADFEIESQLQLSFLADPKDEGCVNCCALTTNGLLITAGDDGVCRLWQFTIPEEEEDTQEVERTPWSVLLVKELTGHTASVMSLSLHPLQPWFSSGSKDGTIKIWDYDHLKLVDDITCADGLPATAAPATTAAATASSSKSATGPAGSKLECRGCCFSSDGAELLAIQSGKRGATHLVRWSLVVSEGEDGVVKVTAKPVDVLIVAKVPCIRLCASTHHKRVAVGASDGSIVVVSYTGPKMVITLTQPCHELPVTGLSFAPSEVLVHTKFEDIVVSCSADYALSMIPIGGHSVLLRLLFVLLSVLVLIGLWYGTVLLTQSISPPMRM